jgi:HK97 gp10 family phage protein
VAGVVPQSAAAADLTRLAADLSAASGQTMMESAQQIIQQAAQQVQAEAQTRAPVKSGRLRDSISIKYPGPFQAVIGPNVNYAVYQEFGTGTRGEFPTAMYEIKPKKPGGVLAFTVNGTKVFTRKVRHPGIKARPFMRPAFQAALGKELVDQMLAAGTAAIVKGPNA